MLEEIKRLSEDRYKIRNWKKWGPYLSERQWGTVREDYSTNGDAWGYVSHDLSRSKAYRWGEDGIGGISDDQQVICFAWAFWNHQEGILKERLFGLTGPQGNHGEDVKEYYYYLDSSPTHSYMKMLYKYPQSEFPYIDIVNKTSGLSELDPEYELIDTGVFDEDKYFDIYMEYAKMEEEDFLIRLTVINRADEEAELDVLPTVWFRNTWSWGKDKDKNKPKLESYHPGVIDITHEDFQAMSLYVDPEVKLLFCENESNPKRIPWEGTHAKYHKDAFHRHIVDKEKGVVNKKKKGTKAAAHYKLKLGPGEKKEIRLRLGPAGIPSPFAGFKYKFDKRMKECDSFYAEKQKDLKDEDAKMIQRQAFAGMMWSKQFYYYNVQEWLKENPHDDPYRLRGRNRDWKHLQNADIVSMPDKWEYPWYAAWDLAFHCIPLAQLDVEFAKEQLVLLTEGWYMHPNGQLPAYEWNFSDVNPPVHAFATWRVYQIEKQQRGEGDMEFLEQVYQKLLLNFSWWVNRKDKADNNIFQGGFLGLDNIGVFDRSAELPTGGYIEQADGTSWMGMYCLNLLRISLELAKKNPLYQKMAGKFFEHFLYIAGAMTNIGNEGINLWDEEDEFFYDVLNLPNGQKERLKVRSMVGLSPLFAVEVLDHDILEAMPDFEEHMEWFLKNRPDLAKLISRWKEPGRKDMHLLSMLRGHRMSRLLRRMLDETEFLSDYGIRALSRYHKDHPYTFIDNGNSFSVSYLPAESDSDFFGGNSNWRGPVWFPVNYILIESLHKFYAYYGSDFKLEYPYGSGEKYSLKEIANELSKRLTRLFLRDENGRRPVFGDSEKFQTDPHFKDNILFYEYFHGDNGRGVGASHQTGWTGLVATLFDMIEEKAEEEPPNRFFSET